MKQWHQILTLRHKTVIFLSLLFLSSCVKNPVTGTKELALISERQEVQIGKESYKTMQQAEGGQFKADSELSHYVSNVGKKVAAVSSRPHLPFEFVIINDSTPNAWALPGGKIAINRGLLTKLHSEAELAAVLGHEITHAAARHGAKGIERGMLLQGSVIALGVALNNTAYNDIVVGTAGVGAMLVNQRYSRGYELEADRFGMFYMAKAGYDPKAAIELQELFLKLSKGRESNWATGLFESHPPSQERIDANRRTLSEMSQEGGFIGESEYSQAIAWLKDHEQAYEHHEKGKKALKEKAYSKAAAYAQKAIASCPKEAQFWDLKAQALLAQGQVAEAKKAFTEAIFYDPEYFESYLGRAKILASYGHKQAAAADLRKSIALLPTGEGHELLGELLLERGQKREALSHLQIASAAESPAGLKARYLLKQLSAKK